MIFLGLYAPVSAEVLKGGVSYTVGTARKIAFENISQTIDMAKYANGHIYDPNKKANINALKRNKTDFTDRVITYYESKKTEFRAYSITYKKNPYVSYYYILPKGMLGGIDIKKIGAAHQRITAKYSLMGSLISVILNVDKDNQFIFDANKKLISHCLGGNCYNEKGELDHTRRVIE